MIRPSTPAPDPILAPLLAGGFAQRLLEYTPHAETLERLDALRVSANDGRLAPDEQAEYAQLIESLDLVAILQAKARGNLDRRA